MTSPSITRKGSASSTARSMNAPGSPSSPLQITYLGEPGARRVMSHLTAVGNPAPPRPRRPERRTFSITSSGDRLLQAFLQRAHALAACGNPRATADRSRRSSRERCAPASPCRGSRRSCRSAIGSQAPSSRSRARASRISSRTLRTTAARLDMRCGPSSATSSGVDVAVKRAPAVLDHLDQRLAMAEAAAADRLDRGSAAQRCRPPLPGPPAPPGRRWRCRRIRGRSGSRPDAAERRPEIGPCRCRAAGCRAVAVALRRPSSASRNSRSTLPAESALSWP